MMEVADVERFLKSWEFHKVCTPYLTYSQLPARSPVPVIKERQMVVLPDKKLKPPHDRRVNLNAKWTERGAGKLRNCTIAFRNKKDVTEVGISVTCDCGQDQCLHSYILLKEVRDQLDDAKAPPALVSWATELSRYQPRKIAAPARDLTLGLLLHSSNAGPLGGVPVPISVVGLHPTGERGGRTRESVDVNSFNIAARLAPGEWAMLAYLRQVASTLDDAYMHRFSLITEEQERVFETLLGRESVFLNKLAGQPLRRGEDITPQVGWGDAEEGAQKVGLTFPDQTPIALVLRLEHLWYVHQGAMGQLIGDPGYLSLIMRAPTVSADNVPKAMTFWRESGLATRLPAPSDAASIRNIRVAPRGVLTLRTLAAEPLHQDRRAALPLAYLTYDYDSWTVPVARGARESSLILRSPTETVRIHRDTAGESALLASVIRCGLQSTTEHPLLTNRVISAEATFCTASPSTSPEDADAFARAIDRCELQGLTIVREGAFVLALKDHVTPYTAITHASGTADSANGLFDLEMGIVVDGRRHNMGVVVAAALADPLFPLHATDTEAPDARWTVKMGDGERVRILLTDLRGLIIPLAEWMNGKTAIIDGKVRMGRLQAAAAAERLGIPAPQALASVRQAIFELQDMGEAAMPETSPNFLGQLRPYQREGLRWLNALANAGLGGILADDMGLGKTLQVLAHVLDRKDAGRLRKPVLVVVPKSLVGNWVAEAARFAPSLRVITLHGPKREPNYAIIPNNDLVITTYNVLVNDIDTLEKHRFSLTVLDESQYVKNAKVQAGKAIRRLTSDTTICVTGTPIENHLGECFAQMEVALPGLLGEEREFNRIFRHPIERVNDQDKRARLIQRLHPFILRRTKNQAAPDLPEKTEIVKLIAFDEDQRRIYNSLQIACHTDVQAALTERGIGKSNITILAAISKLRQACCDPRLLNLQSADATKGSAKLEVLMDMLREAAESGRRVLVFSSFATMLKLIATELKAAKIDHLLLTGETENRADLVDAFQTGTAPVFLISLKAGGVGLNLTAADTVIHYDPWWNPAAENQATDRAHRIGQTKTVTVYRLVCEDTIETRVMNLKDRKGDLANAILDGASTTYTKPTLEYLTELLTNDEPS